MGSQTYFENDCVKYKNKKLYRILIFFTLFKCLSFTYDVGKIQSLANVDPLPLPKKFSLA